MDPAILTEIENQRIKREEEQERTDHFGFLIHDPEQIRDEPLVDLNDLYRPHGIEGDIIRRRQRRQEKEGLRRSKRRRWVTEKAKKRPGLVSGSRNKLALQCTPRVSFRGRRNVTPSKVLPDDDESGVEGRIKRKKIVTETNHIRKEIKKLESYGYEFEDGSDDYFETGSSGTEGGSEDGQGRKVKTKRVLGVNWQFQCVQMYIPIETVSFLFNSYSPCQSRFHAQLFLCLRFRF